MVPRPPRPARPHARRGWGREPTLGSFVLWVHACQTMKTTTARPARLACPQELGGEMQFVIVRPGGLKSEPGTGKGVLTEDPTGGCHGGSV